MSMVLSFDFRSVGWVERSETHRPSSPRARGGFLSALPTTYISSLLLLRSGVASLGLGVHGIEARQGGAIVHLIDDPGFHSFLFGALGQHMVEEGLRDQHGAVLIGDHDIIGEYGNAAAADRLTPTHEGQARDRRRRGIAVAPDRQVRAH